MFSFYLCLSHFRKVAFSFYLCLYMLTYKPVIIVPLDSKRCVFYFIFSARLFFSPTVAFLFLFVLFQFPKGVFYLFNFDFFCRKFQNLRTKFSVPGKFLYKVTKNLKPSNPCHVHGAHTTPDTSQSLPFNSPDPSQSLPLN